MREEKGRVRGVRVMVVESERERVDSAKLPFMKMLGKMGVSAERLFLETRV